MIAALVRRVLCSRGRHGVLRCAGAEDHAWTWDAEAGRWVATLDRIPVLTPVAPVAADQPVRVPSPRAGKNDHGPIPVPRHRA